MKHIPFSYKFLKNGFGQKLDKTPIWMKERCAVEYGIGVAQKGGQQKEQVLNTKPLEEIEKFLFPS